MSQQVQEFQHFQEFEDLSPNKKSLLFTEYLKSTLTNLSYHIKNSSIISMPFISRKSIEINEKDMRIAYLLGKQYSYKAKDEFLQRFSHTIWMSYRKNNHDSDVGWGCMIRAVQMVFAQVFQRHFHYDKQKSGQILSFFKDEHNGCLSLGNICKKGFIQKRFTSSPQIYSIITSLVKQNHKTLLGIDFSIDNFCDNVQIKSESQYNQKQFPKLVSISTKIGQECETHFNEDYFPHLLNLIKDSHFCGIVGGINNEALYIVGQYNDLAIVLDPHYVQQEQKQQTFFEKAPKGVQFTSLKSSITLNFFFQTLADFGQWVDNLILYEKLCVPYLCFNTSIKNPQGWTRNHRKKSQDFQFLI